MTRNELFNEIQNKKSFLCIGLDADIQKIPQYLLKYKDPVFEFNKQIIEATHDLCVAYKPNLAFYEASGSKGLISLEKTLKIIPGKIFTIADAKRGDIGNTSALYARAFLETMNFDAITVAPYMGSDSVLPFFTYPNKWVILLILTSNAGANDFQLTAMETVPEKRKLFEEVLTRSSHWGSPDNLMYVVGATRPEMLKDVRKIAPDNFLLIPGVGAQGGSLRDVCKHGMNKQCGLLVNASRSIIYASAGEDFALKAREEAKKMQIEMSGILGEWNDE